MRNKFTCGVHVTCYYDYDYKVDETERCLMEPLYNFC